MQKKEKYIFEKSGMVLAFEINLLSIVSLHPVLNGFISCHPLHLAASSSIPNSSAPTPLCNSHLYFANAASQFSFIIRQRRFAIP
ncbi:MAG: hypothetical protein RR626_09165, partial [Anaerovoracaceae bacterium]